MGLLGKDFADAVQPVGGCIAADACIYNAPFQTFGLQVLLQKIGIAVAGLCSEPGREAVAESDDRRSVVMRDRGGFRIALLRDRRGGFVLRTAAGRFEQSHETK